MRCKFFILIPVLLLWLHGVALGQEKTILLGPAQLPINEYYPVSISIKNEELKTYSKFPELEGFKKSNAFSQTITKNVNGVKTVEKIITQNYAALKEGQIVIKPFTITINGQVVRSKGATVTVLPMTDEEATSPQDEPDLLAEIFGKPPEYETRSDNSFISFNTSKSQVFVGEGVHASLDFYLAVEDQNLLDFYDFSSQLQRLLKQIKQKDAWEEYFEITEVTPRELKIEGKKYLKFTLYEAVFYPLNTNQLVFPPLNLNMIKYKVAKEPTFFGQERLRDFKVYTTTTKIVKVKPLPPHPLQDVVPVGQFRLREHVSRQKFPVNQSFDYLFQIEGEGNFSVINEPEITAPANLEFYPPDITQNVIRRDRQVMGVKNFNYHVIPKQPGNYDLGKYFNWVYFDPVRVKYDTLRSGLVLEVKGETDLNAMIRSKDMGSFYENMPDVDNTLVDLDQFEEIKLYTNIILGLLLAVFVFVSFKKKA